MPQSSLNPKALLYAWLFCVAILAVVEVGLRLLPASTLLAFDQHNYRLDQALDYTTINRVNSLRGPADILIVGSSRAREGLVPVVVKDELTNLGVQCGEVRSYAASYARARTQYALLRLLRESGNMPHVLVYGVTPFELGSSEEEKEVTTRLLLLRDLWANDRPITGWDFLRYVGNIAANTADHSCRTLWLRELIRAPMASPGVALGGITRDLRQFRRRKGFGAERSLATKPVSPDEITSFMKQMEMTRDDGFPEEGKKTARRVIELALGSKCDVMVVELPVSRALRDIYPDGVYDDFVKFWQTESKQTGIPFVRLGDLGMAWGDADMGDQGHPNWTGAQKLSTAFARILANGYRARR